MRRYWRFLAQCTYYKLLIFFSHVSRCWYGDMEASLSDLHEERDSLRNGIELLASARDNEQLRERKKTIKKQLDTRRRELHSNQERISRLEELLGLEQPQQPPTAQGPLDVIVEETTETTVMTDEETESEATPLGGPTGNATAPVRETEQDMETEGLVDHMSLH